MDLLKVANSLLLPFTDNCITKKCILEIPRRECHDITATTWILFGSLPTGQLFTDRQDDALHARMMGQALPAHEASPPLHCVHGTDRVGNAAKLMETLCLGCTSVGVVSSYEAKADST